MDGKVYIPTYHESARADIQALVPSSARRILDVGCGAGQLGLALKTHRPLEVIGIELNQKAAQIAQTRLDKVIQSAVEEVNLDFPAGYFDLIIFADILEHLCDPWQVLRDFACYLAEDGCVITSIPNISFYLIPLNLLRGHWRYTERGVMDKTHLRFFTLKTIQDMLAQAGFAIETISRNYRLRDKDRRYNRLARLLAKGPWGHLLTYQYLIVARRAIPLKNQTKKQTS